MSSWTILSNFWDSRVTFLDMVFGGASCTSRERGVEARLSDVSSVVTSRESGVEARVSDMGGVVGLLGIGGRIRGLLKAGLNVNVVYI